MRIGIITLACMLSGLLVTTTQAFEINVGPFINGAYDYGGNSTDEGTGLRVAAALPFDDADDMGSGSLGSGSLGSGSGLGTLGGDPPKLQLEFAFDYEQVDDDYFDLTRTRIAGGIGARHDAGAALGTPPPEGHFYGILGYGAFVGLNHFDLDYSRESDTDFGIDLGVYASYEYPFFENLSAGVRLDASYLLLEPKLNGIDLETDQFLQFKLGAMITYTFD